MKQYKQGGLFTYFFLRQIILIKPKPHPVVQPVLIRQCADPLHQSLVYATWVLYQRACVPNFTQIQAFLDYLKFGESLGMISPPPGGNDREF